MSYFIVSDIHLLLDKPGSSERFAGFVDRLAAEDTLIINGDLCDFWFSTRQRAADPARCPALSALREFRARSGELILIAGNHDAHLEDYYVQSLGTGYQPEPLELDCFGFHLHVLHGHLTGPRSLLKTVVAGKMFHAMFSRLPAQVAGLMEKSRDGMNTQTHAARCQRFLTAYRQYVRDHDSGQPGQIFVFGHVHEIADESVGTARMVVLTDWEDQLNYLRIDSSGAEIVVGDPAAAGLPNQSARSL